jgi:FKBP-type peptidyl-prolyl cis-trans isomerase 2
MRRGLVLLVAAALAAGARAEGGAKATVEDGKVVALEYTLWLEDGKLVDTNVGAEPLVIVQGQGEIFVGLEHAIAGMAVGESRQGVLAPKEAYGEVDPHLFVEVDAARIPEADRHSGAQVFYRDESGARKVVRVYEVHGDRAVIDMNHALAGNRIRYQVRVLKIQDAAR